MSTCKPKGMGKTYGVDKEVHLFSFAKQFKTGFSSFVEQFKADFFTDWDEIISISLIEKRDLHLSYLGFF